MTVETKNWGDPLIDPRGRDHPFAVVVTSTAAAKDEVPRLRTNREDYDPGTFIEQTSFDDSYLILVQWFGSSSSDDLELSRIEQRENSVHVTAEVIEPCGASTADMSGHSLFVRVIDERAAVPERATVQVDE